MDKQISVWSYRLALLCVLAMILMRGLAALGIYPNLVAQEGASIEYNTFLRGAVVLLLLSLTSRFADDLRCGNPDRKRPSFEPFDLRVSSLSYSQFGEVPTDVPVDSHGSI